MIFGFQPLTCFPMVVFFLRHVHLGNIHGEGGPRRKMSHDEGSNPGRKRLHSHQDVLIFTDQGKSWTYCIQNINVMYVYYKYTYIYIEIEKHK